MMRLERESTCIFCDERAGSEHAAEVIKTGDYWYVTTNDFPYEGTVAHYLIVARDHVNSFDQLPDAAGAELWSLRRLLKARVAAPAFATVERSGDMRLNGGSVEHLHVHMVALGEDPSHTVRFRVSARGGEPRN
jgi:diadenosine tetraphosphate (Ap4A) HIT family hydrolase